MLRMKMIHKLDLGDIAEDKNDGSLFFPYCTFYGKDSIYGQLHMCLYGTEDHTCAHSQVSFDICLSTRLICHKSLESVAFHTYKVQQRLPRIYKAHNDRHFCICVHKEATCCKDCYTQAR